MPETDAMRASDRADDTDRTQTAVRNARTAVRSLDRELKDALAGGVTYADARALAVLLDRARHALYDAAVTLGGIDAREHGRKARERGDA